MATQTKRSFYVMESDMLCLLCQQPDSISHSFLNCHWSKQFFFEVIKCGNKENGTSSSPSLLEILFGLEQKNYPQVTNESIIKFNQYTLLLAKYFLYTQKLLNLLLPILRILRRCENYSSAS